MKRFSSLKLFFLAAAAGTAILLGFYGLTMGHPEYSLLEKFYRILQLFTLDSSHDQGIPLPLEIARFLAPAVMAWAAFETITMFFSEKIEAARCSRAKNHAVVIGLGNKGLQYAQKLAKESPVICVEKNAENDLISTARANRIKVFIGDGSTENTLRKVAMPEAAKIVIATNDDLVNLNIAEQVRVLAEKKTRKIACYIHILHTSMYELAKEIMVNWSKSKYFDPHYLNLYHDAASWLLKEYYPDWKTIDAGSPLRVHLVILGCGNLGQCLILHAAHLCHYANEKKIKITIIDSLAAHKRENLFFRFPALGEICDIDFIECDIMSSKCVNKLRSMIRDNDITTFIVCLEDSLKSTTIAHNLKEHFTGIETRFLVRIGSEKNIFNLGGHSLGKHKNPDGEIIYFTLMQKVGLI